MTNDSESDGSADDEPLLDGQSVTDELIANDDPDAREAGNESDQSED